ncbi:Uncharacterised protein [uncultured archaeon]|nr:Uncharacterised protein [uncultured archaeon]
MNAIVNSADIAVRELVCLLRTGNAACGTLKYAPTNEEYPTMAYVYVVGRDASGKYSTNCVISYDKDGNAEIFQNSEGAGWHGKRTELHPELQMNLTDKDTVILDDDAESPAGRLAIRNPPPLSADAVAWLLPHIDKRASKIPRLI